MALLGSKINFDIRLACNFPTFSGKIAELLLRRYLPFSLDLVRIPIVYIKSISFGDLMKLSRNTQENSRNIIGKVISVLVLIALSVLAIFTLKSITSHQTSSVSHEENVSAINS